MLCPNCGYENPYPVKNCTNCRINLEFALNNPDQLHYNERMEQERQRLIEMYANFPITTTPMIQGKEILENLGVIYSYAVLGAGLLAEFTASFKDLTRVRSNDVEGSLNQITGEALNELKEKAFERGGNGIVGLYINIMTYGGAILVVCVSGTVVRLVEQEPND